MNSWGDVFPEEKPRRKRHRIGIAGAVVYGWGEYVGRQNKRVDERNLGEMRISVAGEEWVGGWEEEYSLLWRWKGEEDSRHARIELGERPVEQGIGTRFDLAEERLVEQHIGTTFGLVEEKSAEERIAVVGELEEKSAEERIVVAGELELEL